MVLINKEYITYIPYIPNIEIDSLFKVEFDNGESELVQDIERSFSESWENNERVSPEVIDISSKSAIATLVQHWEEIKAEATKTENARN
jgi:hypothetical protein